MPPRFIGWEAPGKQQPPLELGPMAPSPFAATGVDSTGYYRYINSLGSTLGPCEIPWGAEGGAYTTSLASPGIIPVPGLATPGPVLWPNLATIPRSAILMAF